MLRTFTRLIRRLALAAGVLCTTASAVPAQPTALPRSLAAEALAENVPTAFAPADFAVEDFAVTRVSEGAIDARLAPGSLQWVRIGGHLVVPRALLIVNAAGARGGAVTYEGFGHPLVRDRAGARAEVPVVLLASAQPVRVRAHDRGGVCGAELTIRFAPRATQRDRVLLDSTCSPFGLRVAGGEAPADAWLYIACRLVRTAREDGAAATLELYVLWDRAADLAVDGVRVAPAVDSVWALRVAHAPGRVRLSARSRSVGSASREYYNVWLRWGSPQFFGELNYIEWEEPHDPSPTTSRALGLSFGTPLLRFL